MMATLKPTRMAPGHICPIHSSSDPVTIGDFQTAVSGIALLSEEGTISQQQRDSLLQVLSAAFISGLVCSVIAGTIDSAITKSMASITRKQNA